MIEEAKLFAVEAHGNQKYGSKPYVVHLEAVVGNLEKYSDEAKIIGFLHDVVEDTSATESDISEKFGSFVAACVSILTDEPGETRVERKSKTYQKMANVSGELELALVVKAADRLANMQACVKDGNAQMLQVYLGEHPVFKESVYRKGKCDEIWFEIERLVNA